MICFRTDLIKGGIALGVIMSIISITAIVSGSLSTLSISMVLLIAMLFTFPIILGIRRRKSLGQSARFGFFKAFRYSYSMLFIAYFITTLAIFVMVSFIGKGTLSELMTNLIIELGLPITQEGIESISSLYYGYNWLTAAIVKLFISPAIISIIPALIIRKKILGAIKPYRE